MITHFIKLYLFFFLFISLPLNLFANNFEIDEKKTNLLSLIERYHQIEKKYDFLFNKKVKDIEKTYYLLLNKANTNLPIPMKPRDLFETQYEYNKRAEAYKKKLRNAKIKQKRQVKKTHKEFNLRYQISLAEVAYIESTIKELKPIVDRITHIQTQSLPVVNNEVDVILYPPEADKYRFPLHLITSTKTWNKYWNYTDKKRARALWNNKSYLKADLRAQFEIDENDDLNKSITMIRLSNKKTGDSRNYQIRQIKPLPVLVDFNNMVENDLPSAKLMAALKNVIEGPVPGMEFIYISPRPFTMGSPREEPGRWANEIAHKVNLAKGFYLQTTEVTQGQWRAVMRSNPSEFAKCGSDCPVENIYWGDVQEFIDKLNKIEKTTKYRLPTEAEWEYACRAGNKNMGAHDNNEKKLKNYAWYNENANDIIHPVGTKKPNHWGLFDMHGNVSEWCSDWFGPYSPDEVTDPKGPLIGKFRVARGGNWQMSSRSCRAADRNANLPGDKGGMIGFRLVRSP